MPVSWISRALPVLALNLALIAAPAVRAERAGDAATCAAFGPVEERIAACTRMIDGDNPASMRAVADYDAALRISPQAVDALRGRGRAHVRRGDFDRVIADFTAVFRLDPENAQAFEFRADARARHGDVARALADIDRSLSLAPAPMPRCPAASQRRMALHPDIGAATGAGPDPGSAVAAS